MKNLAELNVEIEKLLIDIESSPAEDDKSDDLVQSLLDMVNKRQTFVSQFIDDDSIIANDLQKEIDLTQVFLAKATVALKHRQDLLSVRKSNKQKMNVYKSIESNR
ncbi:hypothetical protein [Shewanella maritima]|uniref:hypothetical protein n=1 Tax=Shewanella maritima TaxID=2520507 RepID=UPI00373565D8